MEGHATGAKEGIATGASLSDPVTPIDLFTNRAPTEEQAAILDDLTRIFLSTAQTLQGLPPSRFKSLAMTKLEECSMWAKKATVFTVGVDG